MWFVVCLVYSSIIIAMADVILIIIVCVGVISPWWLAIPGSLTFVWIYLFLNREKIGDELNMIFHPGEHCDI